MVLPFCDQIYPIKAGACENTLACNNKTQTEIRFQFRPPSRRWARAQPSRPLSGPASSRQDPVHRDCNMGGPPSYAELLSCMEFLRDACGPDLAWVVAGSSSARPFPNLAQAPRLKPI